MGALKRGWHDFLLANTLANEAEKGCKGLWQLFLFPFLAGGLLQSFILFSLFGEVGIMIGLCLVFLVIMYIWCFWFELALMKERAKIIILDQIIEEVHTGQKKEVKEKRPTLH